jgi:hypothetical protein
MQRIFAVAVLVICFTSPLFADDQPALWFYYPTNLQIDQNVSKLEPIWRRAAAVGYSHVLLADSKFAKLGDLQGAEKRYFANVERVKQLAAELKLEIVPAVFDIGYSNALLWHDPNLAEGLPVKDALFVVNNGEAKLQPDPPVEFEKLQFKDDTVQLDGNTATVHDNPGNARFCYQLTLPQFRCYHISVQIRTNHYTGDPPIAVIAPQNRSLNYANLGVKPTQDWTEHHAVFNTLDNNKISIYFGNWDAAKGELQWRDWKIEEVGLLNVLRRPGAPCVVEGYVEGKDYEPIVDPLMGNKPWPGEYTVWHDPPAIRTHLPDGTKLRVGWFHPAIVYDGQVTCCLSEPRVMDLLSDQANRMKRAWGAGGYMMSYDEIRCMNWDDSCASRHLDAGALLADNVRHATKLLDGSDVYVWSDMFDPFHNATKDYYLVRGDLSGSWEGLDKRVVIVNWNFAKRDASLKFFADRGHKQVIAGYYDGKPEQIRAWMESARKVNGIVGVMYTTWRQKYDDLEAFARVLNH